MPLLIIPLCALHAVQDNVHQPLEDVLDYTSFSIRMRKTDVPRMMEVLRSISPQQIQAYRQNMWVAAKACCSCKPMQQAVSVLASRMQLVLGCCHVCKRMNQGLQFQRPLQLQYSYACVLRCVTSCSACWCDVRLQA